MPAVPQPEDNSLVRFNDRLYSAFALANKIHCVPIDEEEEQVSDDFNRLLQELLGGPVLPPLSLNALRDPQVLDCGFGKGAWIDDLLDTTGNESLVVTGVDIFTGQGSGSSDEDEEEQGNDMVEYDKERWNLNASFRDSGLRPESYHLINSRMLVDGINATRWQPYIRELFALLKPGGWLQMVEPYLLFQSDNGSETTYLQQWWSNYSQALTQNNMNARIGQQLGQLMTVAGFERVQAASHRLPIGSWDTQVGLGTSALSVFQRILRSHSAWMFMRSPLTLAPAEYEVLIRGALAELSNPALKLYVNIHVAYGRRPARRR